MSEPRHNGPADGEASANTSVEEGIVSPALGTQPKEGTESRVETGRTDDPSSWTLRNPWLWPGTLLVLVAFVGAQFGPLWVIGLIVLLAIGLGAIVAVVWPRDTRVGPLVWGVVLGAALSVILVQFSALQGVELSPNTSAVELDGADLSGAQLRGASLRGVSLRGTVLDDACLAGADLRGADLAGATLRGADLSGATFDEEAASDAAYWPDDEDDTASSACE